MSDMTHKQNLRRRVNEAMEEAGQKFTTKDVMDIMGSKVMNLDKAGECMFKESKYWPSTSLVSNLIRQQGYTAMGGVWIQQTSQSKS